VYINALTFRRIATLLATGLAASGCPSKAHSQAPLPGVYGLSNACVRVRFRDAPKPTGAEWCIDAVTVTADGNLELLASWTHWGSTDFEADKGSDAGNRKMYLVDDRGRRYDHYQTTGAARFGGVIGPDNAPLRGTYRFRAYRPGASRFTFHDDDQGVVIHLALETQRRVSPEERAAIAERIRTAAVVEIVDEWSGGLMPPGPQPKSHWWLTRTGSGLTGDAVVPAAALRQFLHLLMQAPLTRREPVPPEAVWRPADAPEYRGLIRLGQGEQSVTFSARAEGWWVESEGLVVPSDHVERALKLLRPILTGAAGAPEAQDTAAPPRVPAQQRCRVVEVDVEPSGASMQVGGTQPFIAVLSDTAGYLCGRAVFVWTSSNANVARVDQSGNVTCVAVGTAIITARTGSGASAKLGHATITVRAASSGPHR
jgi:hypothetical protein